MDKLNDAKLYFDKVLQIDGKADYAILQKARIFHREKDYKKVIAEVEKVLGDKEVLEAISVNILLSFYELISYYEYINLRDKYIINRIDDFVANIFNSIDEKFDQPFRILKKLAKTLSYLKPDAFNVRINYVAAFYNDKAETLNAKGDTDEAIVNLEIAIEKKESVKTRENWGNKLNAWNASR